MKLYAYKSKKSGLFFKFEKYCDDGYGKFKDTERFPKKLPQLFMRDEFNNPDIYMYEFLNHEMSDIKTVIFELNEVK